MDKDEITAEAERLGTLPISNIPDQDCCQLFTPKHPSTCVTPDQVAAIEETIPVEDMVTRGVAGAVVEDLRFPVLEYPVARD